MEIFNDPKTPIKNQKEDPSQGKDYLNQAIELKHLIQEELDKDGEKYHEKLAGVERGYGIHQKGYNSETGEEPTFPIYEAESRVDRNYDPESGKASLDITFKDDAGVHSVILIGKIITEDGGLDHLDPETIVGQMDGLKISKEEALIYWKKYFPKEGTEMRKIGEKRAGQSDNEMVPVI